MIDLTTPKDPSKDEAARFAAQMPSRTEVMGLNLRQNYRKYLLVGTAVLAGFGLARYPHAVGHAAGHWYYEITTGLRAGADNR